MKTYNNGQLEIDESQGTIWFNDKNGQCRLRICKIPEDLLQKDFIDLNWSVEH